MQAPSRRDPDRSNLSQKVIRKAYPFRLLRREGRIAGCWFTDLASFAPVEGGGRDGHVHLSVLGMVRSADGRVAGIAEGMRADHDLGDQVLAKLVAASRTERPPERRRGYRAFVHAVREAVALTQSVPGAMERPGTWEAALLDGRRGWCARDDVAETETALTRLRQERNRVIQSFLATLDPVLIRELRVMPCDLDGTGRLDADLGELWPMLDVTFGHGAPLRDAIVPVVNDVSRAGSHLRRHLRRPPTSGETLQAVIDSRAALRMSMFLPQEPCDLTAIAPPGYA